MNDKKLKLDHAPIVEAILDIHCDLPPSLDLKGLEAKAKHLLEDLYPIYRAGFLLQQQVEHREGQEPRLTNASRDLHAHQFRSRDEKQIVQIRRGGYSFNRLAPYSTLDDYLEEIRRTWNIYRDISTPLHVRGIQLRYINKIDLPAKDGKVEFDEYFMIGPRLPNEDSMNLLGFLNQYSAADKETGNQVTAVLTADQFVSGFLPVIFDIAVSSPCGGDPSDWTWISSQIEVLRRMKNEVFEQTLSESCLNLFRQP